MNEQPIVSIITVTYNEVDNIKKTIESVLKQTYTNIKYIIIDGGSTDGTIEIIGQYSDRISFWVTEPDQGIYDAMNKGWAVANQSSYILYLGAGDEIVGMPDMLDPNQDIVYFGDAILGNNIEFKAYANFRLKFGNSLHHQSLLIPKKLNPKPPFNIRYKVYADFDFNQKLMKRKVKFVKSQKLKSVVMPNGFSQHYKTAEWFYIIKSNFGLFYAFVGYLYHHYQQLKMRTSHTNKTFMNKLLRVARNPIRFANYFFIRFLNKKVDKLSSIKIFFSGKKGLEIGGPSQIFKTSGYVPIYPMADTIDGVNFSSTTVWENTISEGETYDFSSSKKGYQFIQDGTDLNMIPSETYDFLLSSHSLEHIANPIKAIEEWLRIIKKGGVLLIIVPDQRYTFDCKRRVTKLDHLIQDYENETSENDLTHLEEIVSLHDLAYDSGINSIEEFKKRSENNFVNRCLHHHVFSLDLLEDIFKHFNLKMVLRTEAPPYHLIALGMKKD